jgi:glycosyltransferase involved in cell wall biosynthesis
MAEARPFRVMFVTPTLGIGGAEQLVGATAAGLVRRGHPVAVAYGFSDIQRGPLDEAGVEVVRLSNEHLSARSALQWARSIRRAVGRWRPDVLYVHSVLGSVVTRLATPRCPMLVTVHGISASDELVAAGLLRLARAKVTAVSAASAEGLRRHRMAPDIMLLPPAVDIAAIEEASQKPVDDDLIRTNRERYPIAPVPDPQLAGSPRICCVARQEPEKGVDVLIRAFALVAARHPEPVLVLVGAGTQLVANKELATSLGIRDRCEFAGFLANAAPSLRAADLVVLPSRREGLPVVALEAFALRRPIVASAVGGTPTIVRDGETGWLAPPDDAPALAAAIEAALADPAEAERRGANGRELVEREYEIGGLADTIEKLLGGLAR